MEYNRTQLKEVQTAALDVLRAFIFICEKLNLRYYAAYGTLLGAVRHQGFIPWDDDIDVYMPREDYEVFISKGQSLLPDNFFIQTADTEPAFMCYFAKLRDSSTTYIESINKNKKMNHGVFIDIFPLDYLPNNNMIARIKTFLFTMAKTRTQYEMAKGTVYSEKENKERIKKIVIYMLFPSSRRALSCQMNVRKSKRSNRYVVYQFARYNMRGVCNTNYFEPGKMIRFEDLMIRAPKKMEEILKIVYGDYMKLPPVEERKTSHHCYIIDTQKSYREYIT